MEKHLNDFTSKDSLQLIMHYLALRRKTNRAEECVQFAPLIWCPVKGQGRRWRRRLRIERPLPPRCPSRQRGRLNGNKKSLYYYCLHGSRNKEDDRPWIVSLCGKKEIVYVCAEWLLDMYLYVGLIGFQWMAYICTLTTDSYSLYLFWWHFWGLQR